MSTVAIKRNNFDPKIPPIIIRSQCDVVGTHRVSFKESKLEKLLATASHNMLWVQWLLVPPQRNY